MNTIIEIAKKLWAPARRLSQDGLSYHHYLTELTWLLLLKIAPAYGVTTRYSWEVLISQRGMPQYHYYQEALSTLQQVSDKHIAGIVAQAGTALKRPEQLAQIITALAAIDEVPLDDLGEVYEYCLEQCAYEEACAMPIAPRSLIDTLVILTQPQPGELIQDPLAGTASFLVAADQYVQVISEELEEESLALWEDQPLLLGMEPNLERQRLALMNCLLHNIQYLDTLPVQWGDSLVTNSHTWPKADVIFSMLVCASESTNSLSKPEASLAWLQHIFQTLKPGGRATVIVPERVLTAAGPAQQLRSMLLDTCVVHTVLRLPLGIFYPHKIPTYVLFFQRGQPAQDQTQLTWFYDARSQFPLFGQYFRLTRKQLRPFELAYGEDPLGQAARQEDSETGRWRCFTRQTLACYQDLLALDRLIEEKSGHLTPSDEEVWGVLESVVAELEAVSILLR